MIISIENPKTLALVLLLVGGVIAFILLSNPLNLPYSLPVSLDSPYPKAPELQGIAGTINAPDGFSLADVEGKVILVDFWTYSCINCIRTQPYLNAWHEKYADRGLAIVGVHTPEFAFEEKYANVLAAVEKAGIMYPVVLDNDYSTWRAYGNHYWPRKYLIDAQGFIRYDHIGEGGYAETEAMIQSLLAERDAQPFLEESLSSEIGVNNPDFARIRTPELYLGYAFARTPLGNPEGFSPEQIISYSFPDPLVFTPNIVYLEGEWKNELDHVTLVSSTGKIGLRFTAKHVNIVAGAGENESVLTVVLSAPPVQNGGDTSITERILVKEEKLYPLISLSDYGEQEVIIEVAGVGFQLYTFTFG
ncbi:MAG: redoxin domain-containing protein [Candidatus Diapherotrites archaeon]|nr:redoxin domain-containing protein [Candidatus Diapherotrites archaeon]MDZ4256656.1 redoxin domain-containing protein [archaeon]